MAALVSVRKVLSYESGLTAELHELLAPLGGMEAFVSPGEKVLLKPNLLGPFPPDAAVTTHPAVVEAAARLVLEAGGRCFVGDSSGCGSREAVLRTTGIGEVISRLNLEWADLDTPAGCEFPQARVARRIQLGAPLAGMDKIINLPKAKTHVQMVATGAVKNLYGYLPGTSKSEYHYRLRTREWLAELQLDLAVCLPPALNIMDAVVGMEGEGPSGGTPRRLGFLAASAETVALDMVTFRAMNLDTGTVPLLTAARKRGFGTTDFREITLRRNARRAALCRFQVDPAARQSAPAAAAAAEMPRLRSAPLEGGAAYRPGEMRQMHALPRRLPGPAAGHRPGKGRGRKPGRLHQVLLLSRVLSGQGDQRESDLSRTVHPDAAPPHTGGAPGGSRQKVGAKAVISIDSSPPIEISAIRNYVIQLNRNHGNRKLSREHQLMKKIIVTGGAGFIGSAVVRSIIGNTADAVCVIDKLTYAGNLESLAEVSADPRYRFEQADICDRRALDRIFTDFRPDIVMHLAAESHVDRSIDGPGEFIQTNIVGTYTLLEAARSYFDTLPEEAKREFRFHHISTDEVYGDLEGPEDFFRESTPYAPSSPYSASKAASDHLVRAWKRTFRLPTIVTNCSNNYGPYHFPEKLIPLVILNALDGKPLPVYGTGAQIRDWLYVEDHARALYLVATRGVPGETYNIGGHNEKKNIEVVETICALLDELRPRGDGRSYREQITFVADRPGHDLRYAIDAAKIGRELGWKPQETFDSGIRKTVEWYLANKDGWCRRVQDGSYSRERLGLGGKGR